MSRNFKSIEPTIFLSYILRSALKICWNYRGQTVLKFDGEPFLTLRFKVRPGI